MFSRRRRSGSEPRRFPTNIPRAPDTCRAPRSKSFFDSDVRAPVSKVPPAPSSDCGCLDEVDEEEDDVFGGSDQNGFSASAGLTATMNMWKQEGLGSGQGDRRSQAQAFDGARGTSMESLRVSVSSRISDAADLSPPRRFVVLLRVRRTCR